VAARLNGGMETTQQNRLILLDIFTQAAAALAVGIGASLVFGGAVLLLASGS
jgi:hypothetical protein